MGLSFAHSTQNDPWRLALNNVGIPDPYPIPHIHDIASSLHRMKVFSKIDLVKACNKITVAAEDVPRTAIITYFGKFELLRMLFGYRNGAQTFQQFMCQVLRQVRGVYANLDDILIASPDNTHLAQMEEALRCLETTQLMISASSELNH